MKRTQKLFALITILCLTSGLIGYAVAQTPTNATYIQPGSMTETADYVIWKDGSNYFSKNGETGQVTTSTNTSTLWVTAITVLEAQNGGKIYFKGNQTHTTPLTINTQYANIIIEGDSRAGIIYSGDGAWLTLTNEAERCIIKNFNLYLTSDSDYGIMLNHGHKNVIDFVRIYGTGTSDGREGIVISGESHWNTLRECIVRNIELCYHWRYVDEAGYGYPIFNNAYSCIARDCTNGWNISGSDSLFSACTAENHIGIGFHVTNTTGSWGVFEKPYIETQQTGAVGIQIDSGAGRCTFITPAVIVPNGTTVTDSGTSASRYVGSLYANGWYVENCVDGYTFNHALIDAPNTVQFNLLSNALPVNVSLNTYVRTVTTTNITIGMRWSNGTDCTDAYSVYVYAEATP